uniref:Uncharacterized protein n=1 Tax=Arundo donax TaxID=35708 RepID=A0A0A9GAD2_ARUDO
MNILYGNGVLQGDFIVVQLDVPRSQAQPSASLILYSGNWGRVE